MTADLKPIRNEADYEAALEEVGRLWGAKSGTPDGDRLDVLATLIDAYEAKHHPIDPPDPVEAIRSISFGPSVLNDADFDLSKSRCSARIVRPPRAIASAS